MAQSTMASEGPVPLRPVSASSLSGIAGKLRDRFNYRRVLEVPTEFVGSSRAREGKDAFVLVLQAGLTSARNEKELQDAMFSVLANHANIDILEESKRKYASSSHRKQTEEEKRKNQQREIEWRERISRMKGTVQRLTGLSIEDGSAMDGVLEKLIPVAEKDTKNLLHLYASKYHALGGKVEKMKEPEPELFIKTSSRPAIIGMIKTPKGMLFAEVKNDMGFSKEDAIEQEISHLLLLLYWWIVVCGRSVEKVYGFTLCGPRCRTSAMGKRLFGVENAEKQYHVSLIELSVPTRLEQLNTASIWESQYPLTDPTGLQNLYNFLANTTLWNDVGATEELLPKSAAWMTLPRAFSAAMVAEDQWQLVPGGTSAVVVRCQGTAGLKSFLTNQLLDEHIRWSAESAGWLDEALGKDTTFYVKLKTLATENHFVQAPWTHWEAVFFRNKYKVQSEGDASEGDGPIEDMHSRAVVYEDYLKTYPRKPVVSFEFLSYAVLMNDRGSARLSNPDSPKETSEVEFADRLWRLWQATILFSLLLRLWHGDVGAHNIVFDPQTPKDYVLIDWDEAAGQPKSRDTSSLRSKMNHNETLRKTNPKLYTDVQFSLTFCKVQDQWYGREIGRAHV